MRDYHPQKSKNFFPHPHLASSVSTEDDDSGNLSSLRSSSNGSYLPANLHVRFGKAGFYPVQNNQPTGGALPEDAYKPQEITNRGTRTKELSASKFLSIKILQSLTWRCTVRKLQILWDGFDSRLGPIDFANISSDC